MSYVLSSVITRTYTQKTDVIQKSWRLNPVNDIVKKLMTFLYWWMIFTFPHPPVRESIGLAEQNRSPTNAFKTREMFGTKNVDQGISTGTCNTAIC